MSREILDCLKRERDIYVKNVIHSQNTAFMFTPALIWSMSKQRDILSGTQLKVKQALPHHAISIILLPSKIGKAD